VCVNVLHIYLSRKKCLAVILHKLWGFIFVYFSKCVFDCCAIYSANMDLRRKINGLFFFFFFFFFLDNEVTVLRDIVSKMSNSHMTVLAYLLAFLAQVSIENPIKGGIVNVSVLTYACEKRSSTRNAKMRSFTDGMPKRLRWWQRFFSSFPLFA
jgi:hypothetical protein